MTRQRISFAGCGTGYNGRSVLGIVLLLAGSTLGPEAVAAQGRLEARATVISASAAREGLALSDSVGRINLSGDTLATVRRVDGAITSVFWHSPFAGADDRAAATGRRARTDFAPPPRSGTPRVARVLEIHYLRN